MTTSSRTVPVSDVMTSHVRTADPDSSVQKIWQLLREERCHHVPIVENDRPVGIVSTWDLVRVARRHGARKLSEGLSGGETASEVMTRELETIGTDESVERAIERIGEGDIHALLVLDDDGGLAGIVTNHDLLHYLFS
jgi:CBS domain-containing protein